SGLAAGHIRLHVGTANAHGRRGTALFRHPQAELEPDQSYSTRYIPLARPRRERCAGPFPVYAVAVAGRTHHLQRDAAAEHRARRLASFSGPSTPEGAPGCFWLRRWWWWSDD